MVHGGTGMDGAATDFGHAQDSGLGVAEPEYEVAGGFVRIVFRRPNARGTGQWHQLKLRV